MRFRQLDRIVELQPDRKIVAEKRLTGSEDYLRDHFPRFPVMPGVLMLEAMFQAAAWLVYASEDFRHAVVRLHEARNVKFTDFVEPGEVLRVTAAKTGEDKSLVKIKAQGMVGDSVAVSGRLVLDRFNVSEREPLSFASDHLTQQEMRRFFEELSPPVAGGPPPA
jgi:3-hydroxyacyl-[acyl-carrier-protein] dehydratase